MVFLINDPSIIYFNRLKKSLTDLTKKSPKNFTITVINIFVGGAYLIAIVIHLIMDSSSLMEAAFTIPTLGVVMCLPVILPMGVLSTLHGYILSKIIKNEIYDDILTSIFLFISLLIGWYWVFYNIAIGQLF